MNSVSYIPPKRTYTMDYSQIEFNHVTTPEQAAAVVLDENYECDEDADRTYGKKGLFKLMLTYGFSTMDGYDTQTDEVDPFDTEEQAVACAFENMVEWKQEHNGYGTWLVNVYIKRPDGSTQYLFQQKEN